MTRLAPLRLDPLTLASLAPAPRRRKARQPPPLEPEQERSLLETGLGAVEYLGRTLDKPGAAARGVIHGLSDLAQGDSTPEWGGGLLNLVPFSDTAGLTDSQDRISGRDLLENFGAPKNKPGLFNSISDAGWDVGGFAAEVLTDPLLYMTGPLGTLTKTGKAAKAAARGPKRFEQSGEFMDAAGHFLESSGRGKSGMRPLENPATLIDQMRAGERSSLGFRIPGFQDDAVATLADLPGGKAIDKLVAGGLEKLHYGGGPISGLASAPMRALRSALDVSAQGQFAPEAQRMADMAWTEARRITGAWEDFAPTAAAREQELLKEFSGLAKHSESLGGVSAEQAYKEFARYAAEMPHVKGVDDVQQLMAESLGKGSNVTEDMATPFYEYFDQMGQAKDVLYTELDRLGGHAPDLLKREVLAKHAHRRKTSKRSKIVEPRDDLLVNVPGGTRTLMRMSRDDTLTGFLDGLAKHPNGKPDTAAVVDSLRQKMSPTGEHPLPFTPQESMHELQEMWIADHYLKPELDKAHGHGTIDDDQWQTMLHQIDNTYEVIDEKGVKRTLDPKKQQFREYFRAQPAEMRDEGIFARQLLEDQQSYMKNLVGNIATMREVHTFLEQPGVLEVGGKVPLTEAWKGAEYGTGGLKAFAEDHPELLGKLGAGVEELAVTDRVARSLKTYRQLMDGKAQTQFIKGIDQVMAAYKWGLTGVFPSFHARNRLSGMWQAWSEGNAELPELLKGSKAVSDHMLNLNSGGKKGAPLGDEFITFLKTNDLLGANQTLEFGAKRSAGLEEIKPLRTLFDPLKPSSWKGKAAEKFNPLNIPGVRTAVDGEEVSANVLAEMSGHAFQYVEALNRAGYAKTLWDKGYRPSEIANMVRRTQFDYSELTSVEQQIVKRLIPFWCVPTDCEILTRGGWKKHNELAIGEEVLGYDVEEDEQVWTTVTDIAVFDYNGQMMHIKSQRSGANFLFTPDHRWPVRQQVNPSTTRRKIVRGYDLRTNHAIPYSAPQRDWPEESAFTPREAAIVGWLITDGHMRYKGWCIYQSPKKFLNEIVALVGEDALALSKPNPVSGAVTVPLSADLRNRLKAKGFHSRKDAHKIVGYLSKEAATAMWDAMYKGDGVTSHKGKQLSFACQNEKVFNAAQMLVQILGLGHMHRSQKGGYVSQTNRHLKIATAELGTTWYTGQIWCPQTGTGTWIMRRNGRIIITGNTFSKKNLPYQLKKLAERPGGRTAQTFRAMSQYDPEEEYTPGFIKEKLAIRSPFQGDTAPGETTFVTQTGLPIEDFNKVVFGPGGGRRSAQKLASNLHPLLTAALRQFTGEDPYTGRDLKSLQSTTENVGIPLPESVRPYVDRIIQGSPASRAFSEAAGVTDVVSGRKTLGEGALDMLTGANFGTYDVEQAKAGDLAKAQAKLAETYPQVREWSQFFVPKDSQGPQAEEARGVVALLRQLEKARKDLREKKEREKVAAAG